MHVPSVEHVSTNALRSASSSVARAAAMQLMRQETKASHAIRIHVYSADSVQRHALLMP